MREYSEKRDFHRMQVNTDIDIIDSNGNTFAGVCRDLSASGMQILVAQRMAVGSELRTTLHPTSDKFPPLETLCDVLRCEPEGDGFLLGVNIAEVTD